MLSAAERPPLVTLLTDFGCDDPYVGVMKGVLLREAPLLTLVDVSHAVPPQAVDLAAFWLARSFPWFPAGTVHLCVVDPGVGTARAPLAVRAHGHGFVGPDNGIFSEILASATGFEVRRIELPRLGLRAPSPTFHGRDVFAPVAAWLASGSRRFEDLGPQHEPVVLERRQPERAGNTITGHVLFVDRFGNLVSDVPSEWVSTTAHAVIAGRRLRQVATYGEAAVGECVALQSSFGTLEIAQREGSAACTLGIARGEPIRVVS